MLPLRPPVVELFTSVNRCDYLPVELEYAKDNPTILSMRCSDEHKNGFTWTYINPPFSV